MNVFKQFTALLILAKPGVLELVEFECVTYYMLFLERMLSLLSEIAYSDCVSNLYVSNNQLTDLYQVTRVYLSSNMLFTSFEQH